MTEQELQTVVSEVIQSLKTNGKTISQLTPVTALSDSDSLEVSGGRKIAFSTLKELVASEVVITEESIKGWVLIESVGDLPEEPDAEERMKAYVLADASTMYVYAGTDGDTLDGKYQSVALKGADGADGAQGPKGDSGVDLGEVVLVNDLVTGGEESALSAEMGKVLAEQCSAEKVISAADVTWIRGKAIDAVFSDANFGLAVSVSQAYYYTDDYIDVEGFDFAQLHVIQMKKGAPYQSNGLVFYDSEKVPIQGVNYYDSDYDYISNAILNIPKTAKYLRTTAWGPISIKLFRLSVEEMSKTLSSITKRLETYEFEWVPSSMLDADPLSANFDTLKNDGNYYTHNYVNCQGYDFLTTYIQVASTNNVGLIFYDDSKNPIVGYNFKGTGACVLKTFQIPKNAVYFRNSCYQDVVRLFYYATMKKATVEDLQPVIDALELPPSIKVSGNYNYLKSGTYSGEKILLNTSHPFGLELYMTATKASGENNSTQAAACYGDTLFTFHDNNTTVEVYNMRTRQRTQVINPSGGDGSLHCNTANFSTEFYDAGDPFPLLYLSNHAIEVWRITGEEGNYAMTLVQSITIEGSDHVDVYIAQDGTFWQIGWGGGATWNVPADGGYMKFTQYKIPSIGQAEVTIPSTDAIKEIRSIWRSPLQGSLIKCNKLYFTYGYGTGRDQYGRGIDVIDLGSGSLLSSINLITVLSDEPEGVFEWDGALYLLTQLRNVYRLYV